MTHITERTGESVLDALNDRNRTLIAALNERDLFSNPHLLELCADEVDCDAACENIWRESDTNAAGCHASERGNYCPNDLAETLRAVAKVARATPQHKD